MALPASSPGEPRLREGEILTRLLNLYAEERQVYDQVLDLSRRQTQAIRRGAPLSEIQGILEQKKACLEIIGRLEITDKHTKQQWADGRRNWSAAARARLHEVLSDLGSLMEEILAEEEAGDSYLIQQSGVVG